MVLFMNQKKVFLLLISLVLMILAVGFVQAQTISDAFAKVSQSFEGFEPAQFYSTAPYIYDAVFLFWLLFAVIYAVLAKKYEGMGGKIALAFSAMATAATIISLNFFDKTLLGDGGPILLTFLMIIAVATGVRVFKDNKAMAAAVFLVLYFGVIGAFPQIGVFINVIQEEFIISSNT